MSNSTPTIPASYMALGAFGILENSLAAYLMATDSQMKNPTYFYMIVSCVFDAIILLPLTFYSSLTLLYPGVFAQPWAMRVGAFLVSLIWYALCFLMVLTCLSRYVQMEMSHKMSTSFTRRNLCISTAVAFLIPGAVFSSLFFSNDMASGFSPDLYLWGFVRESWLGNGLYYLNIVFDVMIAVLINVFNFLSMMSIRRKKKQIQSMDTSGISKREVKLFVQCAVTGCMFTGLCAFYGVMLIVADPSYWYEYLMTQLMWILHHLQNPVIYFFLNARLRRRFLGLFRKEKATVVSTNVAFTV